MFFERVESEEISFEHRVLSERVYRVLILVHVLHNGVEISELLKVDKFIGGFVRCVLFNGKEIL